MRARERERSRTRERGNAAGGGAENNAQRRRAPVLHCASWMEQKRNVDVHADIRARLIKEFGADGVAFDEAHNFNSPSDSGYAARVLITKPVVYSKIDDALRPLAYVSTRVVPITNVTETWIHAPIVRVRSYLGVSAKMRAALLVAALFVGAHAVSLWVK